MIGLPIVIVTYVLFVFFLTVFIYKARKIAGLPVHLRWELAPVPHEKGKSHYGGSYFEEFEWWTKPREKSYLNEAIYMFKEIFFLKGVLENNKKLWYFSLPFHLGMYLLIGMVVLLFIGAILVSLNVTFFESFIYSATTVLAYAGYLMGIVGTIGLFGKRFFDPNLKNFNSGGTIFNLLFLLVVFVSGGIALLQVPGFATEMGAYVKGLISADMSLSLPGPITFHCAASLLFIAYLPFTRMLHFLAKYFTYHDVRWNDEPLEENKKMEKDLEKLLGQPVSWSAPHVNADGKKNWGEIATEDNKS